ncbi:hypothetical protein FRC01_004353, partial [Tulasnella sp. 417]
MAPLGTPANPIQITGSTDFSGSYRSTPSDFSAWATYPSTERFRPRHPHQRGLPPRPQFVTPPVVNIAGPSSLQPTNDHLRQASYQSSREVTVQSDDGLSQTLDNDWDENRDEDEYQSIGGESDHSGDEEGAGQELEPGLANEQVRRRINSSIVVGSRMVLDARQKSARTRMFNLERSEARGGMVFDYVRYFTPS